MGGAGEAERGGQMAQAASRGGRATLLEVASGERSRRARGRRSCQHRVGLPAGLGARWTVRSVASSGAGGARWRYA